MSTMLRHKQLHDVKMQLTPEQLEELKNNYIHAELNCRFDWQTDVGGNSYNADGISSAYEEVFEVLGIQPPAITEEMVAEHLEGVSEDPSDYNLSDYSD